MNIGSADITFNAQHPVVDLIVVADLTTADGSRDPRPAARGWIADEAHVGPTRCGAKETADIKTGPVSRRNHGAHRFHGGLCRHHGSDHFGRKLIAKAGIAGPSLDVAAIAVIDPHESKPAGVY